jgi:hypothetical protein
MYDEAVLTDEVEFFSPGRGWAYVSCLQGLWQGGARVSCLAFGSNSVTDYALHH